MRIKARGMGNAKYAMRICAAASRFSILALAVICADAMGVPPSAFSLYKSRAPRRLSAITPTHKIHVSVTNLQFDQPKQMVEIVIRVFADDLEAALSRRARHAVKIDPATAGKDRRFIEPVMAYLRSSFELKNKAGRPVALHWSGIEAQPGPQADMFLIVVKGRAPGGMDGAQLRNRIFCELFDDQVNIVNARRQGKQIGLMFESKDDFKILR